MILVNPNDRLWFTCPPMSLACLSTALKKAGQPVRVVDLGVERSPLSVLRECLAREERPVVGITSNVATMRRGLQIAAFVRKVKPSATVVFGGPHPSIIASRLLPRHCDAVLSGEGDLVVADLAEGKPFREIPGTVYWDGGLRESPRNGYVEDLDSLPFPDWEEFRLRRYRYPGRIPALPLMTSRGCPYSCINCTKVIHGNRLRTRSPGSVIEEIRQGIANWGIREVQIWDDNFTLDLPRAKEILRQIIRHGLHRKIRFLIPSGIRADIYDEELFDLFARAHFYFVAVALESGSQEIINRMGKKLDLSKAERTVRALTRRGIRVALFFMMGFPFETLEYMERTIDFAMSLPAHHAYFFMVVPFPGTPLYDMVLERGRFVGDPAMGLPCYDEALSCFTVDQYTREELAEQLKRAYRRFYYRPRQIARTLIPLLRDPQDLKFVATTAGRLLMKGRRV